MLYFNSTISIVFVIFIFYLLFSKLADTKHDKVILASSTIIGFSIIVGFIILSKSI